MWSAFKVPARGALHWAAQRAAGNYIAGNHIENALPLCLRCARLGWGSTICPWDKAGTAPQQVLASYLEALNAIRSHVLDCSLSIKLPSLNFDIGMARDLLAAADAQNTTVHFDSLALESAPLTYKIITILRSSFTRIGCTIPARWRRSSEDAERAAELEIGVRLVKGQWNDPGFNGEISRAFCALAEKLRAVRGRVGIASHDHSLAEQALDILFDSQASAELEQLYGLPLSAVALANSRGAGIRIYIPYGQGYLPYAISQLGQRPRTLWWLARDAVFGKRVAIAQKANLTQ